MSKYYIIIAGAIIFLFAGCSLKEANHIGQGDFFAGVFIKKVDAHPEIRLPVLYSVSKSGISIDRNISNFVLSDLKSAKKNFAGNVVVDPGHGGEDPGAIGILNPEKNLNLAVALILKKELEARNFKVVMTREKDIFIPLGERVKIADNSKANLFISIHHDASLNRRARGYSVYAPRDCSKFITSSDRLARLIQREIVKLPQVVDRKVRYANFRVLYSAMPAVLVELGFISNAAEEKLINLPSRQQKVAEAIARGTVNFCAGAAL